MPGTIIYNSGKKAGNSAVLRRRQSFETMGKPGLKSVFRGVNNRMPLNGTQPNYAPGMNSPLSSMNRAGQNQTRYSGNNPAKGKNRFWQKVVQTLITLIVLVVLIGGLGYLGYRSKFWVINKVTFNENSRFLAAKQEDLRNFYLGQNLVNVNTTAQLQELSSIPFVKEAYIQKRIPGEVFIYIKEVKPVITINTPRETFWIDDSGKKLPLKSADDTFKLSELDTLIYTNKRAFKSQKIEDAWKINPEISEELQKKYAQYLKEYDLTQKAEAAAAAKQKTNSTQSSASASSLPPALTIDELAHQEFANSPIDSKLQNIYNGVRAEVLLSINDRFASLSVPDDYGLNLDAVKSLVDWQEIQNGNKFFSGVEYTLLKNSLNSRFVWEDLEIINPITFRVKIKQVTLYPGLVPNSEEGYIYFNLTSNLELKFLQLDTLLEELSKDGKGFSKIDLVGEKIIVS